MNQEIENTIKNLSKAVFEIACDSEMAQPTATYYLHKLLNMVNETQCEMIKALLPDITKLAMDTALANA